MIAELGKDDLSSCSLPADFDCYRGVEHSQRRADITNELAASVIDTAKKVWSTLSGTTLRKRRRMSPAVVEILLGDYVENMAVWAVGACNVAVFLDKCF